MKPLDDDELDALLEQELTHDPGDEYFASFAGRVSARVAVEAAAVSAAPAPAQPNGLAAWFAGLRTPRGLALAGGTLALVVVAGVAYQSAQRGGPAPEGMLPQAVRAPSPSVPIEQDSPPYATSDLGKDVSAAKPDKEARASTEATRQTSPTTRMLEVRPGPNGEDVPVQPRAASDRPSLAAIPGESEQTRAKRELIAQPMTDQHSGESKAAPTATPLERRSGARAANDEDGAAKQDLAIAQRSSDPEQLCGTVRDPGGRPVVGARVSLTGSGLGTTTDANGQFCLPPATQAGTLSVLAVGFRESRLTVSPSTPRSLAVTIDPVSVLGKPSSTLGLTGKPSATAPSDALAGKLRADTYSGEVATTRASVAFARDAEARAVKTPTTAAWSAAAERWTMVAQLARTESAIPDARYNAAQARMAAWELGPDERRTGYAREAVDAFLKVASEGPKRTQALAWKAKLAR